MTLLEWITVGEIGISSKTMWAALMGTFSEGQHKGFNFDVPHDPDDFRRCLKLVNECHLDKEDLRKIKEVVSWFAPFIDNWDKMVELWNEESPSSRCPKLYEFIQELENRAMIIDGWEQTSPGNWTRNT